jgi:hypothetical protein
MGEQISGMNIANLSHQWELVPERAASAGLDKCISVSMEIRRQLMTTVLEQGRNSQ